MKSKPAGGDGGGGEDGGHHDGGDHEAPPAQDEGDNENRGKKPAATMGDDG